MEDHGLAVDHEPGAERERAPHAATVLELHHQLARDLLDPGDGAGETGRGLLDDPIPGRRHLPGDGAATVVGGRTGGQHIAPVPVGEVGRHARHRTPVANAS